MKITDYLELNERLETLLGQDCFYVRHLELFFQKAYQIDQQCLLVEDEKGNFIPPNFYKTSGKTIPLTTGLSMIQQYLKEVSPALAQEFIDKLNNGVIQINYNDAASREDAILESNQHPIRSSHAFLSNRENGPFSLLDVSNEKTNCFFFGCLVHEFIHSYFMDRTQDKKDEFNELYSIYFEFDFLRFLKEHQMDDSELFPTFFLRYQDVLYLVKSQFLDVTAFLLKKQTEGVIDKESYHLGQLSIQKEEYDSTCQTVLSSLYYPHAVLKSVEYLLGTVLGYRLSQRHEEPFAQKLLEVGTRQNEEDFFQRLQGLGFSRKQLLDLDFGSVMNALYQDYLILHHDKDCQTDYQKVKNDGRQ